MLLLSDQIEFIAELVFEKIPGWWNIEPHFLVASHPEIAYQIALDRGHKARGSKRFVGFAELKVKTDDNPLLGRMEQGDANKLVVEKDKFSAFQDPKWRGIPHDPDELETALHEPACIVELDGLDDINWDLLSHAYGSAHEVPLNLKRLASVDSEVREEALWNLVMTIFHQGTLYPATAAAVPFLLKLVAIPSVPNRLGRMQVLSDIVKECRLDKYKHPHKPNKKPLDNHNDEHQEKYFSEPMTAIYNALWDDIDLLRALQADEDPVIRDEATFILKQLPIES